MSVLFFFFLLVHVSVLCCFILWSFGHECIVKLSCLNERLALSSQEEIKSQPPSFERLASYVRRRIAAREDVPYLSIEDQQNLVGFSLMTALLYW